MEKINKEIIISSLFLMGFDKVDALLYMYVLDDLLRYIDVIKKFEYDLTEPTSTFNKYVDFDGMVYSLKKYIICIRDKTDGSTRCFMCCGFRRFWF